MKNQAQKTNNDITRRGFLRSTALTAGFMVVPSYVVGVRGQTPPSSRLNIAGIGVGGQGKADLDSIM
ncbi:MAG: gfo/Idh/MocA family oxidoreductase, partial [Verrucomicrobiae bacterium]|nr:gfo/Idh/MocA family oxidoreductase [Verrucomicrobiae bacterium]